MTTTNPTERFDAPATAHRGGPHMAECLMQSKLLEHPQLRFSDLKIHRGPNGICVEGFVETRDDADVDIAAVIRDLAGPIPVLNRLHTGCSLQGTHHAPPTGAERIE